MKCSQRSVWGSVFLGLAIVTTGCSLESQKNIGGLQIILNDAADTAMKSLLLTSPTQIMAVPSTATDFSCYTVNITGSGIGAEARFGASCVPSDNMQGRGAGLSVPPTPRGAAISVDVPVGTGRRIDVYGFYPTPTACGGLDTSYSGYYLGGSTVDLQESKAVSITTAYAGGSASLACTPPPTGLPASAAWGTGADGDETISSSITTASSTLANTRRFAKSVTVSSIDGTGTVLTVGAYSSTTDFQAGDEVAWFVMGQGGTGCTTAPGELTTGKFGFAQLTATNGTTTLTLNQSITPTPGSILNGAFPGGSAAGNNFCRIQVVRVPNFNNLAINSASAVTVAPAAGSLPSGTGGILVFRVKNTLTATGGGAHIIGGAGLGLNAGPASNNGDSHIGSSPGGFSANGAAGGGGNATGGGGGGGVGGAGGTGGNGNGSVGTGGGLYGCGSLTCAVLGAGGGGASSSAGSGGGIIIIWAKNISVTSGSLNIKANGAISTAAGDTGGGGAGGAIHINAQQGFGSTTLTANGGASANASGSSGGSGSGGIVLAHYCAGSPPAPTVAAGAVGTAGTTQGASGAAGVTNVSIASPEMCVP